MCFLADKKSKSLNKRDIKELREKNHGYHNIKLYILILIVILINFGIVYYIYINKKELNDEIKIKMLKLEEKINLLENKMNSSKQNKNEELIINNTEIQGEELPEISYEKFDDNIFQEVKKQQMEFCNEQNKYINSQFEKQIKLSKLSFLGNSYDMYVYKYKDFVSKNIAFHHSWETTETRRVINALKYFSSLKNIPNDNIYILDIGSNIGWYTMLLAKNGYQVLSFEPSIKNMYILRKNFCLNPNLNITLINRGLFTEEKKCNYYFNKINIGNGMIQCDKNITVSNDLIKSGEVKLTKLRNYIEFLSTKSVALIKIDVEGSEGKAIESGIELISKYHVPFIFAEFSPSALKLHGTDPMQFLEMFEMNGYKFAKKHFLDNNYYTKQELMKKYKNNPTNLHIVYSNIIKSGENNITNNSYL